MLTRHRERQHHIAGNVGQEVEVLQNNSLQSIGFYSMDFNKPGLEAGIYFIRIETETELIIRKLVLSK